MMPLTMVASVKTAPIAPKTMGIVSVSKVLDVEAEAELVAPAISGVWVALAGGPKSVRSISLSEVNWEWKLLQ
jgi:hypothetical protein